MKHPLQNLSDCMIYGPKTPRSASLPKRKTIYYNGHLNYLTSTVSVS